MSSSGLLVFCATARTRRGPRSQHARPSGAQDLRRRERPQCSRHAREGESAAACQACLHARQARSARTRIARRTSARLRATSRRSPHMSLPLLRLVLGNNVLLLLTAPDPGVSTARAHHPPRRARSASRPPPLSARAPAWDGVQRSACQPRTRAGSSPPAARRACSGERSTAPAHLVARGPVTRVLPSFVRRRHGAPLLLRGARRPRLGAAARQT